MNLCNPKICNCEQGRKIKYTNIDDINTLINEFTSNNPNVTCRQVQMNMDIYDIYYDYIDDELFSFHFGEKDWEKPLEYFLMVIKMLIMILIYMTIYFVILKILKK